MSRLFIVNGKMSGHSIEIDKEITTLGRGADNDIHINEKSISRNHLKIINKKNSMFLEDLESHNGTTVNGSRVEPGVEVEISKGDSITLGNIDIVFQDSISDESMKASYIIDLKSIEKKSDSGRFSTESTISDSKRLSLLYDISNLFMESLDIDEICEKIMEALFKSLKKIDDGAVILENKETGELEAIITRERERKKTFEVNYSQTIVKKVIKEGRAVIMSNTASRGNDKLSESMVMMEVNSIMCVPLICKTKILGAIYVQSTKSFMGFDKEDLYLLTGLSSPAALAIENALLYSELKKIEEKRQKLNEELEERVRKRTHELSEVNKNLQLAYSMMRRDKDRLSNQIQGDARGFILNKKGLILGVTDEVLDCSGMTRMELIGKNIVDLVDEDSRDQVKTDISKVSRGVSTSTSFNSLCKHTHSESGFSARIMQLNSQNEKQMLVLIDDA